MSEELISAAPLATPEIDTVATDTVEQTPVVEQPAKLYAGKYSSAEELEHAYQEQNSLLGRQSNEVGELRQAVAEIAKQQLHVTPQVDPEQERYARLAPEFNARVSELTGIYGLDDETAQSQAWQEIDRADRKLQQALEAQELRITSRLNQIQGPSVYNTGVADSLGRSGITGVSVDEVTKLLQQEGMDPQAFQSAPVQERDRWVRLIAAAAIGLKSSATKPTIPAQSAPRVGPSDQANASTGGNINAMADQLMEKLGISRESAIRAAKRAVDSGANR